jgi:hypothetical protein
VVSEPQAAVVDAILSFSAAEDNERFAPCVIRIAHAGLNRNKSLISKEVLERNAKTAYGCPIVCNYDLAEDTIGGHDKAIVSTEDSARLVNLTHPVGYVPEGARYWWEAVNEGGEEKEYLCVEAVLWKREAAFSHIAQRGRVAQSMEISIKINDFARDGDLFIVKAFTFVAFCLLERDEPAMRSACVELLSSPAFVEQFSLLMDEFHQYQKKERRHEMPLDQPTTTVPQDFSLDASNLQAELARCEQLLTESCERITALEAENQELTAYRAAKEADEHKQAIASLRTEFSDLAEETAFQALLEQPGDLTIEALTEKAYALRGRLGTKPQTEFSTAGAQGLPLDSHAAGSGAEHHPYGSAAKYFPKKD